MLFLKKLKIIRPFNCLFSFFCTYFAGVLTAVSLNPIEHILLALSASMIAASGYVINDVFDLEIDKVNRPDRVLPSGLMSVNQAKWLSLAFAFWGILISYSLPGFTYFIFATFNTILLYLYASCYKKKLLIGNLIVAWSTSSVFLYGAINSTDISLIYPITLIAFLYTLIREWTKTIEDMEGDKKENAHTIALVLGKKKTILISFIPFVLCFFTLFFFYFYENILTLTEYYLLNILMILPLFFFLINLMKRREEQKTVLWTQKLMKLDQLLVILIFIFSHFFIK